MNVHSRVDLDAQQVVGAPGLRGPISAGNSWRWGVGALSLLVAAVVAVKLAPLGAPATPAMPPAEVTVAAPLVRDVIEWDDYVGRFAASRMVDVRPRVSGQVVALHFKDGDLVKPGQVLFTIDQRPFLAADAEAKAAVDGAESALKLARSDLARATRLSGDDAISQGEIDQLHAKLESAQASLAAAQARLRERALDLEFTEVRAPIGGRISDRRVDAGNLVVGGDAGSATILTTINALDPIYFNFDASEALFLKAQHARQAGGAPTLVQIRLQDEADYRWTGRLDFTDNGLDPRSGTIRGRATLTNASGFLTPGMFGDMRLATGVPVRALLVPDAAIQTDQAQKTLLVVGADNRVTAKPVTLGALVDGLRVIRTGLEPGDRVVIEGMQGAMPGGKVAPHAGAVAPNTVAAAAGSTVPIAAQATFAR
jgi:RND family efflux transporter MFP subunit